MSSIDDLRTKVTSLRDQLVSAERSLNSALILASPFQVGDIVKQKSGEGLGKIKAIRASHGLLRVDVSKAKAKSPGYHASHCYWDTNPSDYIAI